MISGLRAFDDKLEDGTLVKCVFRVTPLADGLKGIEIFDVVNRGTRLTILNTITKAENEALLKEAGRELERLESANENRVYDEHKDEEAVNAKE